MREGVAKLGNPVAYVQSGVGRIKHSFDLASDLYDDTIEPFTKPALASETRTKETV